MNMQKNRHANRSVCSWLTAFILAVGFPFCLSSNSLLAQDASAAQAQQLPAMEVLEPAAEQQTALEKLIERQATIQKLLPKMTAVTVCLTNGQSSGSGVIIDESGLILTAAHVVEDNKTMTVKFADGRNLTCKVLGLYKPADAAMAQIIEEGEYEFATAAPEGTLEIGQTVLSTGHPSGFDDQRGVPLRMGHIVSFKPDFYSSDAALIGGDSGGPAFNLAGEVIGIHSNIRGDMSVNNDVHIDVYWKNWDQMKSGETVGEELFQPVEEKSAEEEEEEEEEEEGAKEGPKSKTSAASTSNFSVAGFARIQASRKNRSLTTPVTIYQQVEDQQQVDQTQEEAPQQTDQEPDKKTELQELLEQTQKNSGRLKIDRNRLKEYRDRLAKRIDKLGITGGRKSDAWSSDFQNAFADTTAAISQSTFPVMVGGRHVASALLVESRGYLVTKASEVEGRKVILRLSTDIDTEAIIVQIERDLDLALLKIDISAAPQTLPHVDLADHAARRTAEPAQGAICCAVNHLPDKLAGFGVVSVANRALDGNTSAFLGAESADADDTAGAILKTIQPEGPADRAGLKAGDVIESVDDQVVTNSEDLVKIIQSRLPNEDTKFNIRRSDRWLTLPVQLGDKSQVAPMPGAREQDIDKNSTGMSRRRWNFAQGIQHDCAIHPRDCGGALIDLEGRVIGVNIARAGRIKSYAIPVKLASDFITSAIASELSQDTVQGGENE